MFIIKVNFIVRFIIFFKITFSEDFRSTTSSHLNNQSNWTNINKKDDKTKTRFRKKWDTQNVTYACEMGHGSSDTGHMTRDT